MPGQQATAHEISKENNNVSRITVKELRRLKLIKLSKPKQNLFLKYYSECHNVVRSAHRLGISKQTIYDTIKRDPKFDKDFQELKHRIDGAVEENLVDQALQPDMRAIGAVKFYLEHNVEKYKRNPETAIQVNISTEHGQISLNNLLDKPSNHPQDAEFTILSSKKNKR